MIEEFQNKQRDQRSRMLSMMSYVMGTVFVLAGIYFLVYEKFGWNLMGREPSSIDYFIGGLFILYGSWRIYRGYKKNYYR
jgi:threonine/homoserine/homoserine lactone efflux protein